MATSSPPETVDQYVEWASTALGMEFNTQAIRNRYEMNVQNVQNVVQNSSFMRDFPTFIMKQECAFQISAGAELLMATELTAVKKPFESALVKSYRHNVLRNRSFPAPPRGGWIGPENWYEKFDDLVRGTLVCKFLDGPKMLAPALDEYARSMGLSGRHGSRNTDDGYYAFHHYTGFQVDIVDPNWQKRAMTVEFEIQLTTQLQEVLRKLTHPIYETARLAIGVRDDAWKWDVESPRFRTSYLGHTLHLIEAVIVQVRDAAKQASEEKRAASEHAKLEVAGAIPSTTESAMDGAVENNRKMLDSSENGGESKE
jgi:hypothetical protein